MMTLSRHLFGNLRQVLLDNGIQIEYVIDGKNRRIGKKVNGQLVQGFLYDDQLRIVAELDGSSQVVARFIYADGINVPDLMEKHGRTYRLLQDHLGSPRLVIDTATGEIAQELAYDAWGNITFDSNPGFQPFGFAGGLHDPHTRLIRFGARDYDAQLGRWMSKDPSLFQGGSTGLYSYIGGDPIHTTDPRGAQIVNPMWTIPFAIDLACAKAVAESVIASLPGNWRNDKFKHCYVSCILARACGNPAAMVAGAWKELQDLVDLKAATTASWADWQADLDGIGCAADKITCQECWSCCCRKHGAPSSLAGLR